MLKRYYKMMLLCLLFIGAVPLQSQMALDRHTTALSDGWLSCTASANPNEIRGVSHWIKYDLGTTYSLEKSKIWNFNTPERLNSWNNEPWSYYRLSGKLEDGLKDIVIDISTDGVTWEELGKYTIPKASGSSFYEGELGPDFNTKLARYVLITALSNHGGTCYGLGEIKIKGRVVEISEADDIMKEAKISVVPNPSIDKALVTLYSFPKGKTNVSLVDINGKEVTHFNIDINDTIFEIPLSVHALPSGIYILKVSQPGATRSIKIEVLK